MAAKMLREVFLTGNKYLKLRISVLSTFQRSRSEVYVLSKTDSV